jgi:hypothetical protein
MGGGIEDSLRAERIRDRAGELESRLIKVISSSSVLMRALRAARTVDPPDWLIGAGVIRDRVWNHLHGLAQPEPSKDVDLAFFNPLCLESQHESKVQRVVTAEAPDFAWDVTNQAAVHLWYPRVFGVEVDPLTSSADGVATWPETASAVAVRLHADDSIQVVAPHGLDDLFGLICRRNPRRVTSEQYRRRVERLRIAERWPNVQILDVAPKPESPREQSPPDATRRRIHSLDEESLS